MNNSVFELILRDGILDYFDVTPFEKSANYTTHLAEKIFTLLSGEELVSRGFLDEITISDFWFYSRHLPVNVSRLVG